MFNFTPRNRASGFGLAEALVALLLLAVATVGAGVAMVESLATQRGALLRTQAADLAADLAEALRSAPGPDMQQAEIRAWQIRAQTALPQAEPVAESTEAPEGPAPGMLSATFQISLQWRDGRAPYPSVLALPVSASLAGDPP